VVQVKKCSKCGQEKPMELFYRMKASKDGRGPWCKACMDANAEAHRTADPERARRQRREWEQRNPDKVREIGAKKRAKPEYKDRMQAYSREYYAANKERLQPIRAKWHEENYATKRKPKMVQNEANRRARRRAVGGSHTIEQIQELHRKQRGLCVACRCSLADGFHRDHVTPLAAGGSNDISNIQLLCPDCNRSKNARHPVEFMQSRGFLL
jgi:5-methylcytosine-specific restriction endonuclease McrA